MRVVKLDTEISNFKSETSENAKSIVIVEFELPKTSPSNLLYSSEVLVRRIDGPIWEVNSEIKLSDKNERECIALFVKKGEYVLSDYTQRSGNYFYFLKRPTEKKFSVTEPGIFYLGIVKTRFGDLFVDTSKEGKESCVNTLKIKYPAISWGPIKDIITSKYYE